jgi:hypothetical protein
MSQQTDRARGARAQTAAKADFRQAALHNLPYARLPEPAFALSDGAFKQLGALVKLTRGDTFAEITDQEMGRCMNRCERAVQYHWQELEAHGLIERQRRYGRRTIFLRYSLAGSASTRNKTTVVGGDPGSASTRNKTTVVGGDPGSASTRNTVQVQSQTDAHAPATVCNTPPDPPMLNGLETPSDPRYAGGGALLDALIQRGITPTRAQALLDTYTSDRIRSHIEVLDWLLENKQSRRAIKEPAAYLVVSIRDDYAPPKGYVSRATQAVLDQAAQAKAQAAAAQVVLEQAALDKPPTAEEIEEFRTWARGHDRAKAAIGRLALAKSGIPIDPAAQKEPVAGISAKTPQQPAREGCNTIPDIDNSTKTPDSSQDDIRRIEHNGHTQNDT